MFRNSAAQFTYTRTYSRWIDSEGRRETWPETVDRYVNFISNNRGDKIPPKVLRKIRQYILSMDVMPSMRAMWAAGPAAEADHLTLYNCSFRVVDSVQAFAECLYILMCGTGFGFSVESKYTSQLPTVALNRGEGKGIHVVEDSRKGWAESLRLLMEALYEGKDLDLDYSLLRPRGARLKTMGGRSSGPAPLISLHNYVRSVFEKAQGRQLTSLECHDICNQIAEIVVVGGVRRSSQISLSDLNDEEMRNAKIWPYPLRRAMANNSAVYNEKPDAVTFLKEWAALAASGTGERGIFNLGSAKESAPKRRNVELLAGTNPCAEIVLRSKGLCNLSEVVIREEDDLDTLLDKVETATWIGAIQSTFTHFPYLSEEWTKNAEEERLLGVSLTGQMDAAKGLLTAQTLKALRSKAIKVAKHAADKLSINVPAAVTCVKPSGTVSQLVDSSSGVHPRYSQYYIRRYRISATDPLFKLIRDQGLPVSPENGQKDRSEDEVDTWVVSFPVKAPDSAITRHEMSALEQLEWYKLIQQNWCEHNASTTIYVKPEEWFEVGNWVYKNWSVVNGVSFLPHDNGKYEQAPYEDITEKEYKALVAKTPEIDYSKLSSYEQQDNTQGSRALACVGDKCELN